MGLGIAVVPFLAHRQWGAALRAVEAAIALPFAFGVALMGLVVWGLEGDLGWSSWDPGEYLFAGLIILGLFYTVALIVLDGLSPSVSWFWAIVIAWPQLLLGLTRRGCPVGLPCRFDPEPYLLPIILLPLLCLVSLALSRFRLSVGGRRYSVLFASLGAVLLIVSAPFVVPAVYDASKPTHVADYTPQPGATCDPGYHPIDIRDAHSGDTIVFTRGLYCVKTEER